MTNQQQVSESGASAKFNMKKVGTSIARSGPLFVLVVLLLISAIGVPRFFTQVNMVNLLYQAAIFVVLGVGMTFIITGGGIDLSIGAQVALISVVMSGWIQTSGWPVWLAMFGAIVFGMMLGAINGTLVSVFKIPDFIVTLAAMETFRGFALVHSAGKIWFDFPLTLRSIGVTRLFGVPLPVYLALVTALIGYMVYHYTFFGRYTIAIGGNRDAAMLAGIPVRKYKALNYVVMGGLCGFASILLTARLDSAQATMAMNYEIHTIATVIMGGTSLFGGFGSIGGSVVGALILAIIANTMVLLGVNFFWRLVVTGLIIVVAVLLNMWRANYLRRNL